ncbi:hypothetical protein [Bradyrhizobium genosp. P]|uniref:hypothetical protein n=1 Tax=Bradyrhizobium genosp. P TaxID=83641 RepID=UPI003CFB3B3A
MEQVGASAEIASHAAKMDCGGREAPSRGDFSWCEGLLVDQPIESTVNTPQAVGIRPLSDLMSAQLQAEVDRRLAAAEAADTEDDRLRGNKRGDELPDWVADKQQRIARIAEAKLSPRQSGGRLYWPRSCSP